MRKWLVVAGLTLLAALAFLWSRSESGPAPVQVAVEPGPPQPRVTPDEAGFDPQAIAAAAEYAGERNTRALLIGHGGHVVFEKYWGDTTADTPVRISGFAPALAALLVGTAMNDRVVRDLDAPVSALAKNLAADPRANISWRQLLTQYDAETAADANTLARALEGALGGSYEQLVADRLWRMLGAGSFSMGRAEVNGALQVRADCCFTARVADWMRVAELLAHDGIFEGNQFTPPGYVQMMFSPERKDAPHGFFTRVGGQFAARDVGWLEAEGKTRLWIVPSLRLTILRVGDEPPASLGFDEAMIPDTIIRGTAGWQPARVNEGIDPRKFAPH